MPALDIDRVKAALVIGVTGHRDIRQQDRAQLKNRVREVFAELRHQYRSTPFILLSPLAEGADRLVAEVALLPEIGARLIAPLPMPKHMYEADFSGDPDSLKEFNELLAQADQWFEIPLAAGEAAVSHPGPERDLQYEAVGKYIARASQILIALWDGAPADKVGGTAAIVKFQTEGLPEPRSCNLLPPELFPVYHILTPRVSNPNPPGELAPFELRVIYPPAFDSGGDAKEYYERTFGNLDEFNRLAGAAPENEVKKSQTRVIGRFDEQTLGRRETLTLNRFATADVLAIQFQKDMMRTDRALHWLVFLSFSSFVFYAHFPGHPFSAFALALAFLGLVYVIHRRAKRRTLDEKRQDYRALAEGCRVGFFWRLAGVSDSIPDHYFGKQRTEQDWIRNALRGWEIGLDHHPPTAWADPEEPLEFVLRHWVMDEYEYFRARVNTSFQKSKRMERGAAVCLYLAIGITVALFVDAYLLPILWDKEPVESHWMDGAIIAIDLFLAGAALLHHANKRMAHSEHLKQYRRMLNVFDNAYKSIQGLLKTGKVEAAKSCVQALGLEALIENGDWVLLHRERPLEIPHP